LSVDFERILDASPNPYVMLDHDLVIVWANDAYERVTMRSRADLIGRKMFDAFPSDPTSESHQLLLRSLQSVLRTGTQDEIALIRYDIANADGSMGVRYWSATHTPFLNTSGQVERILQHTVDVTELHELRKLRDEAGLVKRASAVQARNLALDDQARQWRQLFEQAPGFLALLEGPNHIFRVANAAYRSLVGDRDLIGLPVAEALPEVVGQGFIELLDKVSSTGEAYVGHGERVLLQDPGDNKPAETYLNFIYQPIHDESGAVTGVLVQGYDVTEEVEAGERQTLLINELNHRVKNTLAIVQGLAMQSFRQVANSEQARSVFDARLTALAGAHNLLTEQNWSSASLIETIRTSIAATAGASADRVAVSGPDMVLDPQAAVSLAMIIHELTTNAIKYGALSNADGKVSIDWDVTPEADLRMVWAEQGGPPVSPPSSKGFGTRLIERGIASDRQSGVAIHFLPEGIRCEIGMKAPKS
jgi:PAS domain S-box-containing protein